MHGFTAFCSAADRIKETLKKSCPSTLFISKIVLKRKRFRSIPQAKRLVPQHRQKIVDKEKMRSLASHRMDPIPALWPECMFRPNTLPE